MSKWWTEKANEMEIIENDYEWLHSGDIRSTTLWLRLTSGDLMYGQFDAREIPSADIAAKSIQTDSPAQRNLYNEWNG